MINVHVFWKLSYCVEYIVHMRNNKYEMKWKNN